MKLGNPRNTSQAAAKEREAQRAAADQFAANALPVIEGVKAAGATSFDAIAMALNARGRRTARVARCQLNNRSKPACSTARGRLRGEPRGEWQWAPI